MPRVVPQRLEDVGAFLLGGYALVDCFEVRTHRIHIAKLHDRTRPRFIRRHALRHQLRDPRVKVEAQLLVDFATDVAPPWPERAHAPSVAASGPAVMTLATAAT